MPYEPNAFKVTVIFPKQYPVGSPILASVWNGMTTELRELESNFTEVPVRGEWRSEDDDDSRMYFITVSAVGRVQALRDFVARWRTPFRQQAMYFDYHPVRFELVED
ncbi:MAG: hypothetical protein HYR57_03685 [Candidatus Koribacter versatilis]|nr:hypothetical protein [Candidatus Koribacter versatilis]